MGEAFKYWYQFRDIGNAKEPVFLQCVNGVWGCQIGFDWRNIEIADDMNSAIKSAIKTHHKS